MHYSSAVITVRELPSKKPCREYNHTRSCDVSSSQVILPFDSEYGIGYKLPQGRWRMELTIDGAKVTDGVILQGEGILERFIDSDKRFKFVSANHPSVADPTSKDNGGVEVKLYKEKVIWPTYDGPYIYTKSKPISPWSGGTFINSSSVPPVNTTYSTSSILRGMCCSASSDSLSVSNCSASTSSSAFLGDVGATVEGAKSDQTIGTTTWNGDESTTPLIFKFQLRGKAVEQPELGKVKQAIECPACKVLNQMNSKFCNSCGTKIS